MKKLGKYLNIALLLVIGATFATQINSVLDFLADLDYTAIGNIIATFIYKIINFFDSIYDQVRELMANNS